MKTLIMWSFSKRLNLFNANLVVRGRVIIFLMLNNDNNNFITVTLIQNVMICKEPFVSIFKQFSTKYLNKYLK